MTAQIPLTNKVATAIEQAMSEVSEDDPDRYIKAAEAARITMAGQLTEYAEAMCRACVKLKHRGGRAPDIPCRACAPRVSHVRSIIQIVQPDD